MFMLGVKVLFLRPCEPLVERQNRGLRTMRNGGVPFYASALNAIDFRHGVCTTHEYCYCALYYNIQ